MAPRRKKAKEVTESSRERERGRSAVRGTYKDVSLFHSMMVFQAWCYCDRNVERFLTRLCSSKETRLQHRLVGSLRELLPNERKVIRLGTFSQQTILAVVPNPLLSPNKLPLVPSSPESKGSQASNPVKLGRTLAAATL